MTRTHSGRGPGGASTAGLIVALLMWAGVAGAQTATPEAVQAALPKLDAYIEEHMRGGMVPGLSIAIVFRDEVVFLEGYGRRAAGEPAAVDADTVFQLASLSKPISSTVVAAIVSAGKLDWNSRIADIDPSFRLFDAYPSEQVTVRDLFAHRSGLPGDAGNELEGLGYDRATILDRLRLVPPLSSFRAGYSYSNFGFTEGGVAAAKTTGKPWEDVAEELLYKPLGMTSTSSRHADFLARANRAALHVRHDGEWQRLATRDPDPQSPAGGVSSTARDLTQWMRLELGSGKFDGAQLISEAALGETHVPLTPRGTNPVDGSPSFYGLGWGLEYRPYGVVWGHAGAFSAGARTVVRLVPAAALGIVVLANAFPTGAPDAVADTFLDLVFTGAARHDWLAGWNKVYDSLFEPAIAAAQKTYANPPAPPSAALPAPAYAGTYANDYVGSAVVEEEESGLALRLGPGGEKSFPLTHFDRDLFLYYPVDEMPEMPLAMSFQVGPDGKATHVTIEDLNADGLGVLARTK